VTASPPIYVGQGGNVGDVRGAFARAVEQLRRLDGVAAVRMSSLWESAPLGPIPDQPWFTNAVAEVTLVEGAAPGPTAFLEALLAIEARLGRDRAAQAPGGPRTIDLDLLLWGDRVLDEPGPPRVILPHPRLAGRAFALAPLVELAGPDLLIPGAGRAGALLAAARRGQALRKIV
jgi:2-amino-4-hydroxy-6-hydroxymethyldihydropteridine diphosphokinase